MDPFPMVEGAKYFYPIGRDEPVHNDPAVREEAAFSDQADPGEAMPILGMP